VLNSYLAAGLGSVTFSADTGQGVLGTLMEYTLNSSLGFAYANSGTSKVNFGVTAIGGYNNFLGGCRLRLANADSVQRTADLNMTRSDGTAITVPSPVTIPANGVTEVDLCGRETQTAYGQIHITPSVAQAISGEIIRSNATGGAEFRTPLLPLGVCEPALAAIPSTLALDAGGSAKILTLVNQSIGLTITNIHATLPGSFSDVVLDQSGCGSALAPQYSCNLTLTPGNSAHAQGNVVITSDNAAALNVPVTVGPQTTTTLAESVDTLALSVNDTGTNAALTGTPRTLTITNTGSVTATSLTVNFPSWPSGTTASATCGSSLAPSASCTITITPGATPSAAPADTNPTPLTINVGGANTNSLAPTVQILTYGSVYRKGYIYSIDDTTSSSGSIGGKVMSLADNAITAPWNNGSFVVTGAQSLTDGETNTATIISAQGSGTYAATICDDYEIDSAGNSPCQTGNCYANWYLPAICDWSPASQGPFGCPSGLDNIYSNLTSNGDIGGTDGQFYQSSTEDSTVPTSTMDIQYMNGMGSLQTFANKAGGFAVRCVATFVP
jgi:hypothetical protein